MPTIEPLGIDNVFFRVDELDAALDFYRTCGLRLKFRLDDKNMALLDIGAETSGLMLRTDEGVVGGRLWLEVEDAGTVATVLAEAGIETRAIVTATGVTCEAMDPSGNVIGFADYSKRPDLARNVR